MGPFLSMTRNFHSSIGKRSKPVNILARFAPALSEF